MNDVTVLGGIVNGPSFMVQILDKSMFGILDGPI